MDVFAFYLPQFHEIPENNQWWGSGFTEWTNTRKSKPLFSGHYQPRIPLGERYYNLLESDTIRWQSQIAKQNGVTGFCFYHYYFQNGKMLLEKPAEILLNNTDININYCFSWANESWSRRWNGKEKDILIQQEYGSVTEWAKHFNYLLPFFQDKRYLKRDNKPVFLIYKPEDIPCLRDMICYWNELAIQSGFSGMYFVGTLRNVYTEIDSSIGFSKFVRFEPFFSLSKVTSNKKIKIFELKQIRNMFVLVYEFIKTILMKIRLGYLFCFNYQSVWDKIVENEEVNTSEILGAFVDWDNSPRRGKKAIIFNGARPEIFGRYFTKLLDKTKKNKENIVFVNAWNEWAEGTYLEPDERFQDQYLQQIRNALK